MSIEVGSIQGLIGELPRGVASEAIILGSGAFALAAAEAGIASRDPGDLDATVSPEALHYLATEQEGWEQHRVEDGTPDGTLVLRKGVYDIGASQAGIPYDDFAARSWRTRSGLTVASLPDINLHNQRRHRPQDVIDTEFIRTWLHDPEGSPLPRSVLVHELGEVAELLPERLRETDEGRRATWLAANGLCTVRALYGDLRIGRIGRIVGTLEPDENLLPATYHNAYGLRRDGERLQSHFDFTNASDKDRLIGFIADPYADIIFTGVRESDGPEYDELRSMRLLARHARVLGYDEPYIVELQEPVDGTIYTQATRGQKGRFSTKPAVKGVTAVDLQVMSERDSVEGALRSSFEDGFSNRTGRPFGDVMIMHGKPVSTIEETAAVIDEYGDFRPNPQGKTVHEALRGMVRGNADFRINHPFPAGWAHDTLAAREARLEHARVLRMLGRSSMTAVEMWEYAQAHTERMHQRFPGIGTLVRN